MTQSDALLERTPLLNRWNIPPPPHTEVDETLATIELNPFCYVDHADAPVWHGRFRINLIEWGASRRNTPIMDDPIPKRQKIAQTKLGCLERAKYCTASHLTYDPFFEDFTRIAQIRPYRTNLTDTPKMGRDYNDDLILPFYQRSPRLYAGKKKKFLGDEQADRLPMDERGGAARNSPIFSLSLPLYHHRLSTMRNAPDVTPTIISGNSGTPSHAALPLR